MNEYDTVELASDHLEFSPSLTKGAQGVIVDLPANSKVAAVEFTREDDVAVVLLDLGELRLVESAYPTDQSPSSDSGRDQFPT